MPEDESLPSRVTAEDVIDFAKKVAFSPRSAAEDIRKRLLNPNEFNASRRAALLLGLVNEEDGNLVATDVGRKVAHTSGEEQAETLLRSSLLRFELYELPLTRFVQDHDGPFDLTTDAVIKDWATTRKLNLSKDVLDRAANTFLRLLEAAKLGTYILGRRGRSTRLEMSSEGFRRLQHAISKLEEERRAQALDTDQSPSDAPATEPAKPTNRPASQTVAAESYGHIVSPTPPADEGYQVHQSKDKGVILWIRPTERSVAFLKALLPVLEFEARNDEETLQQVRHDEQVSPDDAAPAGAETEADDDSQGTLARLAGGEEP